MRALRRRLTPAGQEGTGKIHVAQTAQVRPDRDEADAPSAKLGHFQWRTARSNGTKAGLRHVGRLCAKAHALGEDRQLRSFDHGAR
eukprot:6389680-Prymnesium_polylepis.1